MENLKIQIKIEDNDNLKEVHGLLLELGFSTYSKESLGVWADHPKPIWLKTNCFDNNPNKIDWNISGDHNPFKEITLPELRDLVVLKRNDQSDKTHHDSSDIWKYYVGEKIYCWERRDANIGWHESDTQIDQLIEILKPIEKQMKEYLRKNSNGTYSYIGTVRPEHVSDFMIEIPEGCNIITCEERKCGLVYFHWKSLDSDEFFLKDKKTWDSNFNQTLADFIKNSDGEVKLIWRRHTQPEELPFVDDEPKLNIPDELKGRADWINGKILIDDEPKIETATGYQLDVVGQNTYGSRSRNKGEDDESYRNYLIYFTYLKPNKGDVPFDPKPKSLNNQYAEIEKVRQTLSQRQEQYGSFEDVAMITEQMVDVMRKGYYENLAYNQKMALYMICSKIARIVNGNPNHKDSWHDIAGYATLIDNELVSEKDMPF